MVRYADTSMSMIDVVDVMRTNPLLGPEVDRSDNGLARSYILDSLEIGSVSKEEG
jgi:hypothetical protein